MTKIVAFGDSLTVGYLSPFESAPYASFLKPLLGPEVEIALAGVSGETTADMLHRFDRQVIRATPRYVIVLAGTNDIGWGISTDQIVQNLLQMYQAALQAAITPVACAVPSLLGADDFIPPRLDLNRRIGQEAARLKIPFADLFTSTADAAGRLLERYSQDGLHLTPEGYHQMARILSESVFKVRRGKT